MQQLDQGVGVDVHLAGFGEQSIDPLANDLASLAASQRRRRVRNIGACRAAFRHYAGQLQLAISPSHGVGIDQELLREQVQASYIEPVKTATVDERIREVRKLYPGSEAEQSWQMTLQRYGIQEKELETRIAQQLELMQLVEARLRPGILIDSHSIEIYYAEKLVPQLKKSGAKEVPLAAASTQIKELLTQQKVNDLLASWLQNLRAESQIRTASTFPGPSGTQVK